MVKSLNCIKSRKNINKNSKVTKQNTDGSIDHKDKYKSCTGTSDGFIFSPFFVLSISFSVLPNNFIILGVCNTSL